MCNGLFVALLTSLKCVFFADAPRFESQQPLIFAGAVGEPLRMHCSADGNPKPEIEWRWSGSSGPTAVLSRSEYLVRQQIQPHDFGTYICSARTKGYPVVSRKIILAKKCTCSFIRKRTLSENEYPENPLVLNSVIRCNGHGCPSFKKILYSQPVCWYSSHMPWENMWWRLAVTCLA